MRGKLLIFIILLFFGIQLRAEDTEKDPYIEIVSVEYDYELRNTSLSIYNIGTLTVKLKVAEDISQVRFQYSRPYHSPQDRIIFGAIGYIDVDNPNELVVFSRDKINRGRYFRFGVKDNSDNWHYTPTIFTYDYISPEDLDKIMNNASVEDIESDDISFTFKSNILTIDTSSDVNISVYDLTGHILFNGNVSQYSEIPLSANMIIVKYTTKDQTVTKKFISK